MPDTISVLNLEELNAKFRLLQPEQRITELYRLFS
jgi:hypothetical protein